MGNVQISHYPFDFHTHFWGILPVRPALGKPHDAPSLELATRQFYDADGEILLTLDVKRRLFALCLRKAFMQFSTWFDISQSPYVMDRFKVNSYNRGECFVENAIIAWNLIAQKKEGAILPSFWKPNLLPDEALAALESELRKIESTILDKKLSTIPQTEISRFETNLNDLEQAGIITELGKTQITAILNKPNATYGDLASKCVIYMGPAFYRSKLLEPPASIYRYYDYFNDQMLSANEFLPFDDAYVSRDALKDLENDVQGDRIACQTYLIEQTNRYYQAEGITHTQLSMGRKTRGPLYESFNTALDMDGAWGANNKILYHNTNHNIESNPGELYNFLNTAIEDFNATDTVFNRRVIGVDFLGAESYIDFETLFSVIDKFKDVLDAPEDKKSFTFRIHVGEGSGSTANNRSVFGQLCINTSVSYTFSDAGPYAGFIDRLVNFRSNDARNSPMEVWPATVDLAQKIFAKPYFDLRFNIFSEKTHDRITTIAETNMLSLYHAATKVDDHGRYTYGPRSVFEKMSVRLGHGQHARQYIHGLSQISGLASGLKTITFDTNLGSNFITGSSSNITTPGDYDRAQGIRSLTSFAPARYVMQAIDAVFGATALSDTLYQHAYPLLIGSDGQGVEHTNLERENVRGFVLSVLRSGLMNQYMTDKDLLELNNLQTMGFLDADQGPSPVVHFLFDNAVNYWQQTVGDIGEIATGTILVSGGAWISEQRIEPIRSGFSGFEYYKAPEFDIRWSGSLD